MISRVALLLSHLFWMNNEALNINFSKRDNVFLLKSASKVIEGRTTYHPFDDPEEEIWREEFWLSDEDYSNAKLQILESGMQLEGSVEEMLSRKLFLISVHPLVERVRRGQPSVRLIAHKTGNVKIGTQEKRSAQPICVKMILLFKRQYTWNSCAIQKESGVCYADIILPLSWWSKIDGHNGRATKQQKRTLKIGYYTFTPNETSKCATELHERVKARSLKRSDSYFSLVHWTDAEVELVPENEFSLLPIDDSLSVLVPKIKFYPGTIFTLDLRFQYGSTTNLRNVQSFSLSCKAGGQLQILFTDKVEDGYWHTISSLNDTKKSLTINALHKGNISTVKVAHSQVATLVVSIVSNLNKENRAPSDAAELLWGVQYEYGNSGNGLSQEMLEESNEAKIFNSRFVVQKDSQMGLVSVGRLHLLNTAVLTGIQASTAMKVFSCTHAGAISEVTFSCRCFSKEPSILKATPSCTAVYVDGTELRGSPDAIVEIEYGEMTIKSHYTIWYPEMPLSIVFQDSLLNAIKNWHVPLERCQETTTRSLLKSKRDHQGVEKCVLRHQETEIRILGRFRVDEVQSGWHAYLGIRDKQLTFDLTSICKDHLVVLDNRIASLRISNTGKVYAQGIKAGYTDVQVLSPFSGTPYGANEVQVTDEQVEVKKFSIKPLCALNATLTISEDNVYNLRISKNKAFSRRLQECFLTYVLEYTDGTKMPISEMPSSNFELLVETKTNSLLILESDNAQWTIFRFLVINETQETQLTSYIFTPKVCTLSSPYHLQQVLGEASATLKPSGREEKEEEEDKRLEDGAYLLFHQQNDAVFNPSVPIKNTPRGEMENDPSGVDKNWSGRNRLQEIVVYFIIAVCAIVGALISLNCLVCSSGPKLWLADSGCGQMVQLIREATFRPPFCGEHLMPAEEEFIWMKTNNCCRAKHYLSTTAPDHLDVREKLSNAHLRSSYASATPSCRRTREQSGSYVGSEISIYISDHPVIEVHENCRNASSWNISRSKSKSQNLISSSSEKNLMMMKFASACDDLDWNNKPLGMSEVQLRSLIDSLRETVT